MTQSEELEAIRQQLTDGAKRFRAIEKTLHDINATLAATHASLDTMQTDVTATREVVEAWTTMKNVGRFTKWVAGLIASVIAIAAALKIGSIHLIR